MNSDWISLVSKITRELSKIEVHSPFPDNVSASFKELMQIFKNQHQFQISSDSIKNIENFFDFLKKFTEQNKANTNTISDLLFAAADFFSISSEPEFWVPLFEFYCKDSADIQKKINPYIMNEQKVFLPFWWVLFNSSSQEFKQKVSETIEYVNKTLFTTQTNTIKAGQFSHTQKISSYFSLIKACDDIDQQVYLIDLLFQHTFNIVVSIQEEGIHPYRVCSYTASFVNPGVERECIEIITSLSQTNDIKTLFDIFVIPLKKYQKELLQMGTDVLEQAAISVLRLKELILLILKSNIKLSFSIRNYVQSIISSQCEELSNTDFPYYFDMAIDITLGKLTGITNIPNNVILSFIGQLVILSSPFFFEIPFDVLKKAALEQAAHNKRNGQSGFVADFRAYSHLLISNPVLLYCTLFDTSMPLYCIQIDTEEFNDQEAMEMIKHFLTFYNGKNVDITFHMIKIFSILQKNLSDFVPIKEGFLTKYFANTCFPQVIPKEDFSLLFETTILIADVSDIEKELTEQQFNTWITMIKISLLSEDVRLLKNGFIAFKLLFQKYLQKSFVLIPFIIMCSLRYFSLCKEKKDILARLVSIHILSTHLSQEEFEKCIASEVNNFDNDKETILSLYPEEKHKQITDFLERSKTLLSNYDLFKEEISKESLNVIDTITKQEKRNIIAFNAIVILFLDYISMNIDENQYFKDSFDKVKNIMKHFILDKGEEEKNIPNDSKQTHRTQQWAKLLCIFPAILQNISPKFPEFPQILLDSVIQLLDQYSSEFSTIFYNILLNIILDTIVFMNDEDKFNSIIQHLLENEGVSDSTNSENNDVKQGHSKSERIRLLNDCTEQYKYLKYMDTSSTPFLQHTGLLAITGQKTLHKLVFKEEKLSMYSKTNLSGTYHTFEGTFHNNISNKQFITNKNTSYKHFESLQSPKTEYQESFDKIADSLIEKQHIKFFSPENFKQQTPTMEYSFTPIEPLSFNETPPENQNTEKEDENEPKEKTEDSSTVKKTPQAHNIIESPIACSLLPALYGSNLTAFEPTHMTDLAADKVFTTSPKDTLKVGLLYVNGRMTQKEIFHTQWQEASPAFRSFALSLGEIVDLSNHQGFNGKLDSTNLTNGRYHIYYQSSRYELVFHTAPLMPIDKKDSQQIYKKRHIGNDNIHVVWAENLFDYDTSTITSQFNHAHIIIYQYPGILQNSFFRVCIKQKKESYLIGPVFDEIILSRESLSLLIRWTTIISDRTVRDSSTYQLPDTIFNDSLKKVTEQIN